MTIIGRIFSLGYLLATVFAVSATSQVLLASASDQGLHFEVRNRLNKNAMLEIEVCAYEKAKPSQVCVSKKAKEPIAYYQTATFEISQADLKTILDKTEDRAIQFRFRDSHNKTAKFWACKEHPYTVIDAATPQRHFYIDITGSHAVSYACRIYREQGATMVAEEKSKGTIETILNKFSEKKTWFENEEGLTFSIENKIKEQKPRLKVRVCSFSNVVGPIVCMNMNDEDFVLFGKKRIYHISKQHLDTLLQTADEHNMIQFGFEDSVNSAQQYRICLDFPATQLRAIGSKKTVGHRFEVVVHDMNPLSYRCKITSK